MPNIKEVEAALAGAGLSRRQRRALLKSGWSAVVGEEKAELDELRIALAELAGGIGDRMSSPSSDAVARDCGPPAGDAV